MSIVKPAATPLDFLEMSRRAVLTRYLVVCKALEDSKFPKGEWDYLYNVLNARVTKAFQKEIEIAQNYWGKLEVQEALKEMGSHYTHLLDPFEIQEFRRQLEETTIQVRAEPKQLITPKKKKGEKKKK
jgi:hypothetical protein